MLIKGVGQGNQEIAQLRYVEIDILVTLRKSLGIQEWPAQRPGFQRSNMISVRVTLGFLIVLSILNVRANTPDPLYQDDATNGIAI
jgi:hypothetical protein